MADAPVVEATGRDWAAWKEWLDAKGARDMPHAAIAKMLANHGVRPWWRQMVTVGYERMIGRREPGQTCSGTYAAGASRTIAGNMDSAREKWVAMTAERAEFAGALATGEPRLTESSKWRYWRVDLDDGTKVAVSFSDRLGGKSTAAVNHEKLADIEAVARSKAFWKELLAEL